MLVVFAALAALMVVTLGAEIQLARRGPDLVAPDTKTLAATFGSGSSVDVLWLGDSTAAAVGASRPAGSLSSQVGQHLVDGGTAYTYVMQVIAVSGDRVSDVLSDQLPQVNDLAPDVVVVSIGANDVVHLSGAGAFHSRYSKLIDGLIGEGVPADHIVLIGVPDMGAPTRLKQPLRAITGLRARRLDREVRNVAKDKGVHYVDLFHATSKPFRANPKKYLASDKYHPSDAGYALWADAIAPAVTAAAATSKHG